MTRLAIRLIAALAILSLAIGLMRGSLIAVACGVAGLAGTAAAQRESRR